MKTQPAPIDPEQRSHERLVRRAARKATLMLEAHVTEEMRNHFYRAEQEIERQRRIQEEIVSTLALRTLSAQSSRVAAKS